jgi:hypothetical protein
MAKKKPVELPKGLVNRKWANAILYYFKHHAGANAQEAWLAIHALYGSAAPTYGTVCTYVAKLCACSPALLRNGNANKDARTLEVNITGAGSNALGKLEAEQAQ